MKLDLSDKFVIAGTGARAFADLEPVPRGMIAEQLARVLVKNQEAHPDLVIVSGGATGWDHALTLVATELEIPYYLCIPNKGYGAYYWREHWVDWTVMCRNAVAIEYTMEEVYSTTSLYLNGLHSNFVRNLRMVELADAFVVYDASSRGTSHCVKAITAAGKPYKEFKR